MKRKLSASVAYSVAGLILIVFIYPFIWMILNSFKTVAEITSSPWGLPEQFRFWNYIEAWRICGFSSALRNSLIVASATVIIVLIVGSMSAFSFAFIQFRGRALLYLVVIGALMIPFQSIMIPLFILVRRMHLINTYAGLVLPQVALGIPLSVFVLTGFFRDLPQELLDAARIDGCKDHMLLVLIVLPLSKAALSAVLIVRFLASWNDLLVPLVILTTRELRTIPLAIQVFFMEYLVQYHYQFAVLTCAIIPVAIVYLVFQKRFIQGMASGALKE